MQQGLRSALLVCTINNSRTYDNKMKKKILMLPCIAAVAIASFVGKQTLESSAYESNELLMANVEALSSSEYVDNFVRVRQAYADICWKPNYSESQCNIPSHGDCKFYTRTWKYDHQMYRCLTITADRYKNGSWTLCKTQDEQCDYHISKYKPKDEQGHTYLD